MRTIKELVVHCSATEGGKDFRAKDIDGWHKGQGWAEIGYHYVITLAGCLEYGRSVEKPGAHVSGHNADTIGICLIGGVKDGKPADTFTKAQKDGLKGLLTTLRLAYPSAKILGHRDFPKVAKACPSFDVRSWCRSVGIDPK